MMTVTPVWRDRPAVRRVFAALGAPSVDVRAVGGSVRDAVRGDDKPDAEIDIATPETPDQVLVRLKAANVRAIPTGLQHGTVTAVIDGETFEITSLRRDTACDGRHAAVEFTTDWHEDARRRDFTMNALSMSLDGVVQDDHNGVLDARAGRVRFVGDPVDRIREDYLRILRLFRFAALYGREPIDAQTLAACGLHKDGLAQLSAERIQTELAKMLAAADPTAALRQMADCGVLAALLPGSDVDRVACLIVAEGLAGVDDRAWVRRLAALTPGPGAQEIAARLKLSHADRARLEALSHPFPAVSPVSSALEIRHALYELGRDVMVDRLLVAWARDGAAAPAPWRALVAEAQGWTPHPLPVGGADVLALGVGAGPAVGRLLAGLTEWWVAAAFVPSREDVLEELQRRIPKA